MNSIDIDVGGTFTDLVLNYNGRTIIKKVPTTPYDLSVCFTNVIDEGAQALGIRMEAMLPGIDMIRYSTTIALNRLIERKGPDHYRGARRHDSDRARRAVDRWDAGAGATESERAEEARSDYSSRVDCRGKREDRFRRPHNSSSG